ncbi:hypothetical protein, partial [Haloferula sp.]|uniref:hypothetical protein n=1 Tax=Haloferula sp. TaxID=2497595 RepID=UPI00329FEEB8
MSSDQVDVIYSDMAAYLRRNGFTESPGVPGGGVRSEGAIQHWFVREDGWNRETAVRVDVQDRLLHTYVHWEAHGTPS